MRLRVLLDEIAYAIRVRLPKTVRGLGEPEGPGPILYKQFRINKLLQFVRKQPTFSPHLTHLSESNRVNIHKFIGLRDDIAHFRAKASVIRAKTMSVGFIGSRDAAPNGQRFQHTDLRAYVNGATMWTWQFLQQDAVKYFRARVENGEIRFTPCGIGPHRIGMPDIRPFKETFETRDKG
jgi:hypothetical protein